MKDNTELVRLARKGDAHAFARLYEMIYKDLYRFAVFTLRSRQDAEDAVSEAVMDAFAQIGTLRDANAFKAWMFRILSAKCKRKIQQYANAPDELSDELGGTDTDLAQRVDVQRAFAALPWEDRMILSMNVIAGYSSQETAQLLGMNANTVRSRQSRALRKLELALS